MKQFQNNILNIYGKEGEAWLLKLPRKLKEIAAKWNLSNLKPVANLSYNYVLYGFRVNQPIVLKLALDIKGLKREAEALKAFQGFGAVNLLAESEGALLLVQANGSLKEYFPSKDTEAISITCNIIKNIHNAPINYTFPHIRDWLKALDNTSLNGDIVAYLPKARKIRDHLLSTSSEDILLHGDLHHDNILKSNKSWVVIDPKGVIGESIYEVAAFIRNPILELLSMPDHIIIIENRILQFAELLNIEPKRIREWCFVQAVLAWIWALEDNTDYKKFTKFAKIFNDLL